MWRGEVLEISQQWRALWWLALLCVHGVAAAYNLAYALFYWQLHGTYLDTVLEFIPLGLPAPFHRSIATAHGVMGGIHAVGLMLMVAGALRWRALRFTPFATRIRVTRQRPWRTPWYARYRTIRLIKSLVRDLYYKLLHRNGLFGVNSKYFHFIQVGREILETTLRSIQAYRMSAVLPRVSTNRFYVVLVVSTCWAPLLLHYTIKRDEQYKRFFLLALDLLLDLVVSVGVPVVVAANYIGQYDYDLRGFPSELWYDDHWTARAINELQLVLVMSRADLFSRIWFSIGVLTISTSMKQILSRSVDVTNRVFSIGPLGQLVSQASVTSRTASTASRMDQVVDQVVDRPAIDKPRSGAAIVNVKFHTVAAVSVKAAKATAMIRRRVQLKVAYYVLMMWGVVVLALHIHAESIPALPECILQVRPWGVARPSCYLVEVNCYFLGIEGSKDQVGRLWSDFDPSTVVQLLVKHCSALGIPSTMQDFNNLNGLKIYNSTLIEWGSDAAFTRERHPSILSVYMVRVNLTDGQVPAGLLWRDFPPSLRDFEFVATNLRTFPDDLDEIWPSGSMVYAEMSELVALPASLLRLQPLYLSVFGSPVTYVPVELFEVDNLAMLHLGSTLISELPDDVLVPSWGLSVVYVSDTNVSSFSSWADPAILFVAGGSPYCDALDRYITTNDTDGFPAPAELAGSLNYSVLMDPSQLELIQERVFCYSVEEGFYPLSIEDLNSALSDDGEASDYTRA